MKIVLPKTLAEPGTIPWFMRSTYNTKQFAQEIRNAIDEAYDRLMGHRRTPCGPELIVEILAFFERVAKEEGGINVTSNYNHLWSTNAQYVIGYTYRVFFQVPQDPVVHVVIIHKRFKKDNV